METRFLTVFPLRRTEPGQIIEDANRGQVIGRTRYDDKRNQAHHIATSRSQWDSLRGTFYMTCGKQNPCQGDVDFKALDGSIHLTAEACLANDLHLIFGVSSLEEVKALVEGASPVEFQALNELRAKLGDATIKAIKDSEDLAQAEAFIAKQAEDIAILKAELEAIKQAPQAEPARRGRPPATATAAPRVMTKEATEAAINKANEILRRGALTLPKLAKAIHVSEAALQRILDDREDLFIVRGDKIYVTE